MLKRLIGRLSQTLKGFRMADVLPTTQDDPAPESSPVLNPAKRGLDETGDGNDSDVKKQKIEPEPMKGRLDRKRKVALLMAYSGTGYYGMQINPGFPTIESELCKALVSANLIPQDHSDNMFQMSFQRAARTDKGVSALGQVVSLKMTLDNDDVVGEINKHLPDQIRVMAIKRTTKSFNSKNFCNGRTYIYMLPTYAFAPVEKFIDDEYRITDEIIDHVNKVLLNFKGTHNFHNYTSGIKPKDPSAKRYMLSLLCGKPFVRDNLEFVIIKIHGQSFMMHHIRKMIGVTISIVRGYAGEDLLVKTWGTEKVDIPKAPGLGLMLEQLHYDGYNKRFGNDGLHECLDWSVYQPVMDEFSEKYVYSNIVKKEKEERSMFQWLTTLPNHSFDVRDNGPSPAILAKHKIDQLNKQQEEEKKGECNAADGKEDTTNVNIKDDVDNNSEKVTEETNKSDKDTSNQTSENTEAENITNSNDQVTEETNKSEKGTANPSSENTEAENITDNNDQVTVCEDRKVS